MRMDRLPVVATVITVVSALYRLYTRWRHAL